MTNLHFAQISDLHISTEGDAYDMLSARAADLLADIVTDLNRQPDLDFVLITGDLFFSATEPEFDLFRQVIGTLQKPYYVIPGNHDHREPGRQGLSRSQFAQHFNPQFEAGPSGTSSQVGYWSLAVGPEIQLIGLDSVLDSDWAGRIEPPQLAWLEQELVAWAEKLVILAVHHPLHILAPIDHLPRWRKFVCLNGPEILALLDRRPQVKIVLTGHHHMTKADRLAGRLHLACPAVAIYPCAYRTFRLRRQPDRSWQLEWQTHSAADPATRTEARQRMIRNWTDGAGLDRDFVEAYVDLAWGSPEDRMGRARL